MASVVVAEGEDEVVAGQRRVTRAMSSRLITSGANSKSTNENDKVWDGMMERMDRLMFEGWIGEILEEEWRGFIVSLLHSEH